MVTDTVWIINWNAVRELRMIRCKTHLSKKNILSSCSLPTKHHPNTCYHHSLKAKGSGAEDWGKEMYCPRHSLFTYLLLYLLGSVVSPGSFPPCPLERGGSQLERGARGYHCLHCVERHTEELRDSVQVQRGRVRGNTPGGPDFFFSQKSDNFFLRGLFRDIFVWDERLNWGTSYLRDGKGPRLQCFLLETHTAKVNKNFSSEDPLAKPPKQCYEAMIQSSTRLGCKV